MKMCNQMNLLLGLLGVLCICKEKSIQDNFWLGLERDSLAIVQKNFKSFNLIQKENSIWVLVYFYLLISPNSVGIFWLYGKGPFLSLILSFY